MSRRYLVRLISITSQIQRFIPLLAGNNSIMNSSITGRKNEAGILEELQRSEQPEFLAINRLKYALSAIKSKTRKVVTRHSPKYIIYKFDNHKIK